jgi:hypothetical protein
MTGFAQVRYFGGAILMRLRDTFAGFHHDTETMLAGWPVS